MNFKLSGKAKHVFAELKFMAWLEKATGQILVIHRINTINKN